VAAAHIPYTAHLDPFVIGTRDGAYVQTLRVAGGLFECATAPVIQGWHERLNILWRNVASPQLAVWTHLVRRRASLAPESACAAGLGAQLQAAYRARLAGGALFDNALYLSLVYRPLPQAVTAWTWRLTRRRAAEADRRAVGDALEACRKLRELVGATLDDYDPVPLGLVAQSGGHRSELLEFLTQLVNAEGAVRWLTPTPLDATLASARLSFGTELLEYRAPTHTRWAGFLGIKEYPQATAPGVLDALLAAPYPLVLTQSFTFLSKATAQGLLQRQSHRLANAGDFALSQAQALRTALDALTSNEFVMGDHHFSLQVLTDRVLAGRAGSAGEAGRALADLQTHLAEARTVLADAGITTAREDLALEAAFWAQLPGQFALRPRKAPLTSRNFAALAPLHGYATGRSTGNHWGEALATLTTRAATPYHFNLHAADIGHTFICGPTGSGKTAFIAFLIAQLTRFNVTQIVLDKDRGLELLVRALGGAYLPLKSGEPTGLNPLALPPTESNVEFLTGWLARLVYREGAPLTVTEAADLEQALRATLDLPPPLRRLSRVVEYLDASVADGVYARLSPWCASTRGERAWLFDAPRGAQLSNPALGSEEVLAAVPGDARCVALEALSLLATERGTDLEDAPAQPVPLAGMDVTDFLGVAEIREPVTLYLFHLVRQLLDGRRLVCWIDEFWRVLADPGFQRFAIDGPKTWRKLNAAMVLATQSPSDVLASPVSRTVVEQTATQVFFPNAQAQAADYVAGFGLSAREYAWVREELLPGSRQFLVRQARDSVVCEWNLNGLTDLLAVLAGRAVDVRLADAVRADVGEDPAAWLPAFWSARGPRPAQALTPGLSGLTAKPDPAAGPRGPQSSEC
jgi:type IV secretion system protein VirB4